MLRKRVPLLIVALALGAAPTGPRIATGSCPGADPARVLPPVRSLFADRPETRAVLVLADGCRAVKAYAPGYGDGNRFISWSMAKSVTAMLVGALVADGRLALDAPAPVAEWRRPGDPRGRITLRMLLQMRSGLRHTEIGADAVEQSDTNQVIFVDGTGGMAARAIAQPLESTPGTRFEYSSLTSIILAEIVTRTLTPSRDPQVRAQAYRAFAQARLFGPAGVRSAVMEFDGAGTQVGGSLMHMTLDDWGRMGMLLLDGRSLEGRPVITPAWLAFLETASPTNSEYGGHVWLNRTGGVDGPFKLFPNASTRAVAMRGHLGQLVAADPDGPGRGSVVIRLGHTEERAQGPVNHSVGDLVTALERR